jgi:uncharacterized metal-binding protein
MVCVYLYVCPHKRQHSMNYIFVSAGYEITQESHFYRDWQCEDCNSMEHSSTQAQKA